MAAPAPAHVHVVGVRALPLRGATPDGGWQDAENQDVTPDDLHCLVEVTTNVGVGGLGSSFTSGALVEGALALLRPMLIGQLIEPARVSELLHQRTFWQARRPRSPPATPATPAASHPHQASLWQADCALSLDLWWEPRSPRSRIQPPPPLPPPPRRHPGARRQRLPRHLGHRPGP